ncbi:MAG: Signal transduction histidine kinase [Marmoricola sp.]|nr:Signal transduction histidine kinase [Marmoricola sp.]
MHRVPLRLLGWVLACLLAIALGRRAVLPDTGLALFWPAAGVGALWVLSSGPARRAAVDAAVLAATVAAYFLLLEPLPPAQAALLGVANAAQALVVRRLVGDRSGLVPVRSTRDLTRLFAACFLAALVGSLPGCLSVWAGGGGVDRAVALDWVVRNTCGTFVVAAAALTCLGEARRQRGAGSTGAEPGTRHPGLLGLLAPGRRRTVVVELALTLGTTVLAGLVMFGATRGTPLGFLLIGVAAWVGFRFSPAVGAIYSTVFGALVILLTLFGQGPFGALESVAARATVVQAFVTMTTALVLMLALGVAEKNALADRLAAAEARARTRADLLDAVTEAMTDGLCVTDSWGHVVLANSAAAELAGGDEDGNHVHDRDDAGFLHPDGTRIAPDDLPHARALRGERVTTTDVVRVDPATGAESVLQTTAVPLHHRGSGLDAAATSDQDGPLAVVLLHDVTHERAEKRMLENFAGVVAHDLKGPLTGVLSWAELAREQVTALGPGDAVHEVQGSLERIQSSAARMSALITDLLDYTVAGSAELQVHSIDLDEVVASVVADLEVSGPPPVVQHEPLGHVLADPLLVRQLFANLLGNAVKYVEEGVLPQLLVESGVHGDRLEVRVTDNGIGIPAADRGRVFDSFFRSSTSGDYPGTGLGLAICARAVERHGGRISARPGPDGQGTTMILTLPHDPDPHPEPAPDPAAAEPAAPVTLERPLPADAAQHPGAEAAPA